MRFSIALAALAAMTSSCQVFPITTDRPEISSGQVLFQDDFSDPTSGWDRISNGPTGVLDYTEGSYRIFVAESFQMLWSGPGLRFEDVSIEVDITNSSQYIDDNFGVVCRAEDKDNFYFLVISSDGYYGIGKVKDGVQRLIGMPSMLPSEDIKQGATDNHLRAQCLHDKLSIYTNGIMLGTVVDTDFEAGDVGLIAGTFGKPGTEVRFDNLTVSEP